MNLTAKIIDNGDGDWIITPIEVDDQNGHHPVKPADKSTDILEQLKKTKAQKLVIDLGTTDRIDSQGMKVLLDMHRIFSKEDIPIVLRNPNSHLYRLLRIMQFSHIFEIEFADS